MKYRVLFSIQLLHRYYINGKCSDAELLPTEECKQNIQRYRLVMKRLPYGVQFLSPVVEDEDMIPLDANMTFRFFLKIKNEGFLQFTDFEEDFDLVKSAIKGYEFPYYSNTTLAEGEFLLPMTKYRHRGSDRQYAVELKNPESFHLQNLSVPGLAKENFIIEGLAPEQSVLDYDENRKMVWINTENQPKDKTFWLEYDIFPAWPPNIFAVVDIINNDSLPKRGSGPIFQIQFEPRKATWKYYVISNLNGLAISAPFTFSDPEPPSDTLSDKLKAMYPGATLTLFTSADTIEYKEKVIQDITLKKNSIILVPHLPNPKPSENGIQIINIFQPNIY